jgi:uncharacterized protein YndB with AHSA1/START domain
MFKKILLLLAALIVVFLVAAAFQPEDYRVVRSRTIAAPAAIVFAPVNDFHRWTEWSPWEKLDPALQRSYEGPASGVGAVYAWKGNSQVGEGRATITESRPNELIRMRLDFLKPFESSCTAEYLFHEEGKQTTVSWSMAGKKNYVSKAMCMIMSMDKMVGGQFEEGLANLAKVSETTARQ